MKTVSCLLSGLVILLLVGCKSMGPGKVTKDRFDYTGAVAESWKSQMLLNLVKIRYGDAPVFLDVGQIVAGYSFQRGLSGFATGNVFSGSSPYAGPNAMIGLSGQGLYNDSPTITYTPLSGERFARSLMMPIPPSAIMNVIQAGFPVDLALRLTAQALNGVDNRRIKDTGVRPADPEFYALLRDLSRIQNSGDFGVRLNQVGGEVVLELVLRPKPPAAVEYARADFAKILGLDPATREFRIVYGAVPKNNKEIALLSRSIYEVLVDLSWSITVPEAHVAKRRVSRTPEADLGPEGPITPLIQILHSADRPADAFIAVPYRDYWYSIDDQDMRSKKLFSFLMFIFTFVETGSKEAAPVLTIPTTR